ncbi:MAG: AraC family transcriptional regulator [Pseudohongiella sp.]|nr:AraC family transcriptional regulator [Pseudohongiella sp.]
MSFGLDISYKTMKPAASGRILFWNGGSLWIGLSGAATEIHSHHAVQISLSLSKAGLRLYRAEDDWKSYDAAIVAAHQNHAFDGGGELTGNIFVEPESRYGQALQQRAVESGILRISDGEIDDEVSALLHLYIMKADDTELVTSARNLVARLAGNMAVAGLILDPRIERAIQRIREKIGASILLADIAESAHLSPDRFRHLFLEQTGIRFRPYVLWLRIELALSAYTANRNLTEAAQAGGFADSAHFTRTFKSMFGIAPSSVKID